MKTLWLSTVQYCMCRFSLGHWIQNTVLKNFYVTFKATPLHISSKLYWENYFLLPSSSFLTLIKHFTVSPAIPRDFCGRCTYDAEFEPGTAIHFVTAECSPHSHLNFKAIFQSIFYFYCAIHSLTNSLNFLRRCNRVCSERDL